MSKLYNNVRLAFIAVAGLLPFSQRANEVARFTMEPVDGYITEAVSGNRYEVSGIHAPEAIAGARGKALRLDGYSTFVEAQVGGIIPAGTKKMTVSLWCAVETYPIVEVDVNTGRTVAIASCLDDVAKTGFGFFIGFDGRYSFKTYVSGWPLELSVSKPLMQYEWINLTAVVDTEARAATLYNNGEAVATSKANGGLRVGASDLRIGRSHEERFSGPFCITSFNGAIDDITIWDEAVAEDVIKGWSAENDVDLSVPVSRFADDVMRPSFHGMPGANWTNETHGMTYHGGRYHLFFQKNANGPFMSRLHWGHLSSENLYDWREERIALTPGADYDIKGCWSGCVFTDNEITGGEPNIIYTGVDYAKAVIAQAVPADGDLLEWEKKASPIINGRPAGLSDDFRDPYFFRTSEGAYIIVGSGKNGVGTTTLHCYNNISGTWSNDGRTFFSGSDAAACGTFWEMPSVTEMGDRWLFSATPLNTSRGVTALYWVGSINADGTFAPDKSTPSYIELPGFAKDGYGLLSPTVLNRDGKTIAMGIVPDKLPSQANYDLGYAHTYSLPREWTINENGSLCQKPFAGLQEMRKPGGFSGTGTTLDGPVTLDGVEGRMVELLGEFSLGNGKCGFTLLDDGNSSIKVYYDAPANEIVVDFRGVDRLINDAGVFDGLYRSVLPRRLAGDETVKLHVFFDHSILDIFVNDTWASSVRVFAKAKATERVTAFADAPVNVKALNGWMLDAKQGDAGISEIHGRVPGIDIESRGSKICFKNAPADDIALDVYDLSGRVVYGTVVAGTSGEVETGLKGFHIVKARNDRFCKSVKVIFR